VRSERAAQSARQFLHASPRGKLRRRASTQLALRRGGLETAVDIAENQPAGRPLVDLLRR
jgi:hypothetical protein